MFRSWNESSSKCLLRRRSWVLHQVSRKFRSRCASCVSVRFSKGALVRWRLTKSVALRLEKMLRWVFGGRVVKRLRPCGAVVVAVDVDMLSSDVKLAYGVTSLQEIDLSERYHDSSKFSGCNKL